MGQQAIGEVFGGTLSNLDKVYHGVATNVKTVVDDELLFEAPVDEVEAATSLIKTEMESAFETKVPLLVEVGVGDNWLQAH